MIKYVLRYLLELYHMPKLVAKLQSRAAHMIALVITATAEKVVQPEKSDQSDNDECSQSLLAGTPSKTARKFVLLDTESMVDREIFVL